MLGDPTTEQLVGVTDRVVPAVVGERRDGGGRKLTESDCPSVVGKQRSGGRPARALAGVSLGGASDRYVRDDVLYVLDFRRVHRARGAARSQSESAKDPVQSWVSMVEEGRELGLGHTAAVFQGQRGGQVP